jgi:nitroreductase
MYNLEQTINQRHSTRKLLTWSVPRAVVEEAVALALHAPSNSNIQPWRMVFASGAGLDRLKGALMDVARRGASNIPTLPEAFRHYRQELGAQVYGVGWGIALKVRVGRAAAVLRNFVFFGAPLVGIACMHRDLGPADALSVAMYLQTLLLAATARGLDTCVEVSVAGSPEILHRELGILPDLSILCGLAVGYSDPGVPVNRLHIGHEAIEKSVGFLDN